MGTIIVLIIVLPALSALLTLVYGRTLRRRVSRISIAFLTAAFVLASVQLWMAISGSQPRAVVPLAGWPAVQFDPLGALMAWVVAGISLIVHLFSRRYMAEEPGLARFFSLLNLMTAALLAMVMADNLILLLAAWHLVGVLLYLLLGHDLRNPTAHRYAIWTLVTFRLGDLPLVLAAVLLFKAFGTWSLTGLFAAISAAPTGAEVMGLPVLQVAGLLIAFSAFARSAQFVTHMWLPYTMGGPTPVSALMHAGIVNAGGFLINRFAPLYVHADYALHLMVVVGLVTAVVGSVLMLVQHDIKKSLGYSTMSQMGFMIMECGLGAFSLAIFHLIAHGVFKGTLFLGSGGVIREARQDDGVPPEELYSFVVERRLAKQRRPWLLMAGLTVAFPLVILFLAHYFVEQSFFEQQGAVVLLFFGWMTGAQLIFATHHMRAVNPLRLFGLILSSFVIVVLGYVLIAHAFAVFLYPDDTFRSALYAAAGIRLLYFDIFVGVLTTVIVLGWLFAYYSERRRLLDRDAIDALRRGFYRIASRELMAGDLSAWASRLIVSGAARVNAIIGTR